jgi:uncharacterized Tic20 family protein
VSEKPTTTEMTQDDRIMAALGHATIIWPLMGIIAPVIIWATQREKSDFVAFQALQAAVYHITLILGGLVWGLCLMCSYFGIFVAGMGLPLSMFFTIPLEGPTPEELPPGAVVGIIVGFVAMFVFYLLIFALLLLVLMLWAAYIAYGLYGAVATLRGKDFRYVIIGSRLERYLKQG